MGFGREENWPDHRTFEIGKWGIFFGMTNPKIALLGGSKKSLFRIGHPKKYAPFRVFELSVLFLFSYLIRHPYLMLFRDCTWPSILDAYSERLFDFVIPKNMPHFVISDK